MSSLINNTRSTTTSSYFLDSTLSNSEHLIMDEDFNNKMVLALPAGHLGVHFSNTIPCEICRVENDSPIFESTLQCIGHLAFHLSIPDRIEIYGALDNVTLETILAANSNSPNRKLIFKNKGDISDQGVVTTTVLPTGPIDASFQTSGFFPSRHKIFVEKAGSNMNFEFPIGHFVEKLIIPNQVVIEGGIRTPDRLFRTLNHFASVPGRKIVFQKNIPRGGTTMTFTFPKGHTGLMFYTDSDVKALPVVSKVLVGSSSWQLNVPPDFIVEKLIVPNEISIERMSRKVINQCINQFSEVEGRVLVLKEFHRDVSKAGATVMISLPTGELGVVFKSHKGVIWLADVKKNAQIKRKCPVGYFVESLVIPGELELIGIDELISATFLGGKIKESSHVSHRILVLKQYRKDVGARNCGTRYNHEIV